MELEPGRARAPARGEGRRNAAPDPGAPRTGPLSLSLPHASPNSEYGNSPDLAASNAINGGTEDKGPRGDVSVMGARRAEGRPARGRFRERWSKWWKVIKLHHIFGRHSA